MLQAPLQKIDLQRFAAHLTLAANALTPWSRNSRFQRCNTFGFTSHARATSPTEAPSSSRLTAASLNSFVNCLRNMLMTLISI
jgi:hypothetical protein